jgi:hypothetical protein
VALDSDQARPARRSLPWDIVDELTKRNVKISLGGSIHDPTGQLGRLPFNVPAMVRNWIPT